jgi:hypothetical protein
MNRNNEMEKVTMWITMCSSKLSRGMHLKKHKKVKTVKELKWITLESDNKSMVLIIRQDHNFCNTSRSVFFLIITNLIALFIDCSTKNVHTRC